MGLITIVVKDITAKGLSLQWPDHYLARTPESE